MNIKRPPKFLLNASQYIRDFCHSVSRRGIVNFTHDITFANGVITMLMADAEMLRFYSDSKFPAVCTDKSGRTLENGIYINQLLEKQDREYAVLMKKLNDKAKSDGLNYGYGQNCLHYVVREADCQHMYSLFFDYDRDDFLRFVINNGAFIRDMIDEYNFTAKDIIIEAQAVQNRITLSTSSGLSSSQNLLDRVCVIHKNTGLPIYLSSQRGRCLLHLLQGKSTKEIAQDLRLSPKTIEHYLEMLRKELGCRSSKELIIFYAYQFD